MLSIGEIYMDMAQSIIKLHVMQKPFNFNLYEQNVQTHCSLCIGYKKGIYFSDLSSTSNNQGNKASNVPSPFMGRFYCHHIEQIQKS